MQTILVIDDDAGIRGVIQQVLEGRGFKVLSAETGEEGVFLACTHAPHLVLCDVYMEGLDGYGVLSKLRESASTASTPVILMTGQADLTGLRHGMTLGADDYLPKPFTSDSLLGAIQTRLQKHQTLLAEAERDINALRANISMMLPHELLTPMTGIMSAADLLKRNASTWTAAEIVNFAGLIHESGRRLHRLVNNCLIYAQIELLAADPGRVTELRVGKVTRMGEPFEKQLREQAAAGGRGGDLTLDLAPTPISILETHLLRILAELLDNALKFSKPGTPVIVKASRGPDSALVEVSDRGRGMSPEQVKKVTAYMQFDRRLFEQQGSGLGLTLARRLAELYGGELYIDSVEDHGTTVRVLLPEALL
jgi:signal transduction histidine kinase